MKNLAASVHARLARRRAETGDDYNVLLVRFSFERLLYRLSISAHRNAFVLKGAMLFTLWLPKLHRVTRDLDLLGFGQPSRARLEQVFRDLCRAKAEADGVGFDPDSIAVEEIRPQNEHAGTRVRLKARIGQAEIPLQVDVAFGDILPVGFEEITFPVLLGMAAPRLRAYRRESVVAEKLEAIARFGMLNTRFKDYFDLHSLAQNFSFVGADVAKAIAATFEHRGTVIPNEMPVGLTQAFAADPEKVRGWAAFYRKTALGSATPSLEQVVRSVTDFVGPPLKAAVSRKRLGTWEPSRWTDA